MSRDQDDDDCIGAVSSDEEDSRQGGCAATSPQGLCLHPAVVTPLECEQVIRTVRDMLGHRGANQAMRFGVADFPDALMHLAHTVAERVPLFTPSIRTRTPLFDQLIVNRYVPPQGLASHIDLPHRFADGIMGVSLCGTCVMHFKRGSQQHSVLLRPGDVLAMHGESRWEWEHGIDEALEYMWCGERVVRQERLSVTFRAMLPSAWQSP